VFSERNCDSMMSPVSWSLGVLCKEVHATLAHWAGEVMHHIHWKHFMVQLARQHTDEQERLCVQCWYDTHDEPFPADCSSSLCPAHVQATWAARHSEVSS